jgi:hypothetical protein
MLIQFVQEAELARQARESSDQLSRAMDDLRSSQTPEEAIERHGVTRQLALEALKAEGVAGGTPAGIRRIHQILQDGIIETQVEDQAWEGAIEAAFELDPFDYVSLKDAGYRRELTEAVKLAPNLSETHTALASLHLAEGSYDLAIEQAQAARNEADEVATKLGLDACVDEGAAG